VSLTLRSTGPPLPEWAPGAHIDVVLPSKKERQYSLCGDPANRNEWRVGVLREVAGRGGSAFVCDELAEGTVLTVRGPRNNFPLVPATRYVFIAGGIGITPILPMLRAATDAGTPWQLWYGGRRLTSMAFTSELADYGDRVHLWPQDECGLLPLDELLATPADAALVYCCGPAPLLAAVEQRCASWPAGALHLERFAPVAVAHGVDEPFEVELARSRKTVLVPAGTSIIVAFAATGIAMFLGVAWGFASALREGWIGEILMRVADTLMAMPVILLGLVLVAAFGASTLSMIVILGLLFAPATARIARSTLLVELRSEYYLAAVSVGASGTRIVARELLPNALPVLVSRATLVLAEVIFVEASLSFVGLGVQPPDTSWGTLLQQGYSNLYRSYAYPIFPGLVILVAVLALNTLGDNLQKVLDPSRS